MAFNLFSRPPESLILALEMNDARTASRIHGEAFARAWGDGEFESLISQQSVFGFLACPEGRARDAAAGFVLCREAAGEAEILSIGISPKFRRGGLGWRLMRSAMHEAWRRGAEEIFLEVDETNAAAVQMYRKLGFAQVGERRGYYAREGSARTTALVMRRDLG
ncbi:GNAT family N-acetyltransferase [Hoeflea sp. YIM 152468]|uniref:GNAT family N-acetyltransferase n=1 Tax=Hoeflea sp. YIM 152468 TaxID=3031759 RepID=UPI0023DC9BCA|nr:GNAT family N-acetyltransferase [Hoeflea sp. YIM 152468]MDF1610229.1 GNAT family N-acetyltransferase [Hoeflea sp. YIM 152468]